MSLETSCVTGECDAFSASLYEQLSGGGYEWPMSVLQLHPDFDGWLAQHGTARKRAARARDLHGYAAAPIRRHEHEDAVHRINVSLDRRQGRPMSDGYRVKPEYAEVESFCPRHGVHGYGVFDHDLELVAYCFVYRSGTLALVSQILGHGEHLERGVMFLLLSEVVRAERWRGGFLVYNRHDSGTAGLRWFKERFGFEPVRVTWVP